MTDERTNGRKVENSAVFCWTRNRKKQHHSLGKLLFNRLQVCSVRQAAWDSQRQEGRQQEKRVRVEVQQLLVVVEVQAETLSEKKTAGRAEQCLLCRSLES